MYRITLNNGKQLDATMAAVDGGILTVRPYEPMTVAHGAEIFEDAEATAEIAILDPFGTETILHGYTYLISTLREQNNGRLTVSMVREE